MHSIPRTGVHEVMDLLTARENMEMLPQAFLSISGIRKFRQSDTLFEAGAVLFAKGAITAPEFLKTVRQTPYQCRPRELFDEERASPETLLEAAIKLKEAKLSKGREPKLWSGRRDVVSS